MSIQCFHNHLLILGISRAETGSVESMSSAEVASRPSTAGFSGASACATPFRSVYTPLPTDMDATAVKTEFGVGGTAVGDIKQEMVDSKKFINTSMSSDGSGSPRKDFSIHGLLSSSEAAAKAAALAASGAGSRFFFWLPFIDYILNNHFPYSKSYE